MMGFGMITRYIHGAFVVRVSHMKRAYFFVAVTVFSYCLLILVLLQKSTEPIFFFIALFAAMLQGVANCFGESLAMGFLKGFPNGLVGDFGAGTGFSGILASFTLSIVDALEINHVWMFCFEVPTALLYYVAFRWLVT